MSADRKAKLEKALAYDDTLQDVSAHPEAFRQGRAAEMVRLAPLHSALLEAVEALEAIQWSWDNDAGRQCGNLTEEALAKIDKVLGEE